MNSNTDTNETANDVCRTGTETLQKFRSCPIKVGSLRNSLRTSIASKRNLMTDSELQFVESVIGTSENEDELETMSAVLSCKQTFFEHSTNEAGAKGDADERTTSTASMNDSSLVNDSSLLRGSPDFILGSKRRQDCLQARKKQSKELSKKRARARWKKVAITTGWLLSNKNKNKDKDKDKAKEEETNVAVETEAKEAPAKPIPQRHVHLRQASSGEGIEIGESAEYFFGESASDEEKQESDDDDDDDGDDDDEKQDEIGKGLDSPLKFSSGALSAFDENNQTSRHEAFRRASANIYGGKGFEVADEDLLEEIYDGDDRKSFEDYDPWLFQETDKTGKRREFSIIGTSHDDMACHPHVLSPVQMDRFQNFLPDIKKGESFWLKYSLVRDGASTISFLKQVRASPYTLLAVETVDGEVFGGFFSNPWTVQPKYFGTGKSFLWRMKNARKIPGSHEKCSAGGGGDDNDIPNEGNLAEQIERESDLEIFPSEVYYGNDFFQMCHHDKIAAGGGTASFPQDFGSDGSDGHEGKTYAPHEIGFGLHLGVDGYLLEGSSSASLTYRNPPLAKFHADGSVFEVLNLEAWGFTPCLTEGEARILEYKNMFFKRHASSESFGN